MNFAPIALFIYNRPEHTRRTLDALMQCPEFAHSPLYVFCDGPKNAEDENRVHMARTVARGIAGSHGEFIESETNRGLAHSIITGVGRLCHAHERVIAVEDDLLVSRHFFGFLNRALDRYEHETKVMQVSAYMFPIADFIQCPEAFFSLLRHHGDGRRGGVPGERLRCTSKRLGCFEERPAVTAPF